MRSAMLDGLIILPTKDRNGRQRIKINTDDFVLQEDSGTLYIAAVTEPGCIALADFYRLYQESLQVPEDAITFE